MPRSGCKGVQFTAKYEKGLEGEKRGGGRTSTGEVRPEELHGIFKWLSRRGVGAAEGRPPSQRLLLVSLSPCRVGSSGGQPPVEGAFATREPSREPRTADAAEAASAAILPKFISQCRACRWSLPQIHRQGPHCRRSITKAPTAAAATGTATVSEAMVLVAVVAMGTAGGGATRLHRSETNGWRGPRTPPRREGKGEASIDGRRGSRTALRLPFFAYPIAPMLASVDENSPVVVARASRQY